MDALLPFLPGVRRYGLEVRVSDGCREMRWVRPFTRTVGRPVPAVGNSIMRTGAGRGFAAFISRRHCRRTHASLSRKAAIDPKLVADQLGHGIGVNLDVYTIAVNTFELSLASTLSIDATSTIGRFPGCCRRGIDKPELPITGYPFFTWTARGTGMQISTITRCYSKPSPTTHSTCWTWDVVMGFCVLSWFNQACDTLSVLMPIRTFWTERDCAIAVYPSSGYMTTSLKLLLPNRSTRYCRSPHCTTWTPHGDSPGSPNWSGRGA
jgi:hypothetical protein